MNTPANITQLYNALFQIEAKLKSDKEYPIHKRLNLGGNFNDIYEYLISKIDVKNKSILDAGCGVGFGSLLFAKNNAAKVVGISVSDLEIESAHRNKSKYHFESIDFQVSNFENTAASSYDLIFCVESLKHSLDFDKDFNALLNGLNTNGKLIIVDDFFEDKIINATAKSFMTDWNLNFLLALSHFSNMSDEFKLDLEDLTHYMPKKSVFKINIQLLFFKVFRRKSMFKKLFKGGLLLDKLFAKKVMKYQLISITKQE
ncbi:class I SAM-dependent methyltransferase [Flavobacterium procerum]|uniref:Class I SAM-dependent methyltransferase n=1 Tax=Flavobacterium procerum TaxID=1455569 RepID=A0ABV6BM21_9FLAO